jgi:EmrB/QacA subfamily drug resistance transporter
MYAALLTAVLLGALDQLVFATALPVIVGELHGMADLTWVTTTYVVASTVTLPVYGRLGDQLGRRPLFALALVIFMAGSVIGMTAAAMPMLILGRTIQGLGGGGIGVLAMALIADTVPARNRGPYLGLISAMWAIAGVLGPVLGGFFAEGIGWRWALAINLPFGLLALLATLTLLPHRPRASRRLEFDWAGAGALAVAVIAMVLFTSRGGADGWTSGPVLALGVVLLAAVAVLAVAERRATNPILLPALFANGDFVIAIAAGITASLAMFGVVGYLPTWIQMTTGIGATASGFTMAPISIGIFSGSLLGGFAIARTGRYRVQPIIGACSMAIGLWILAGAHASTPPAVLSVALMLFGGGLGLSSQTWTLVVQNGAPHGQVGTATGALNFLNQIGSTLGLALTGSIFSARLVTLLAERTAGVAGAQGLTLASLSPTSVTAMDPALRRLVVSAYEDALLPVYAVLAPLVLGIAVLALFLSHRPLATTLDHGADHG